MEGGGEREEEKRREEGRTSAPARCAGALVLLSGGLDSLVALAETARAG